MPRAWRNRLVAAGSGLTVACTIVCAPSAGAGPRDWVPWCTGDQTPADSNCKANPYDGRTKNAPGANLRFILLHAPMPDELKRNVEKSAPNATFFWKGAIDTLQPYLDKGTLVVPSGQTEFGQAAILRWLPETAQKRMENILTVIGGTKLQGVLSPYDGLSIGIISALTSGGYSADALPVITGQDAEVGSIKSIIAGEQYSTIFKDTRELARVTAELVEAVLAGKAPQINDTKSYNNGVKVVPAYLLTPVIVDKSNWKEVLVDSGYYKADQFK